MEGVAEKNFQQNLQQDRLLAQIFLQNQLNEFTDETQGIVSTYNFLLEATATDPVRSRAVLKAIFAKLKDSPGFLWFFDNACQIRTSYSSTGDFPELANLCEESGTLLKSEEMLDKLFCSPTMFCKIVKVFLRPIGDRQTTGIARVGMAAAVTSCIC